MAADLLLICQHKCLHANIQVFALTLFSLLIQTKPQELILECVLILECYVTFNQTTGAQASLMLFPSFFSLLLFSTDFLYSIFILPNLVWVHLHSCFLLVSSFFQPFLSELEHKFHIPSEPLNPQCSSKQKTVTKLYAYGFACWVVLLKM